MPNETTGAASSVREPFVVMAKPFGPVCNMECRYCYYLGASDLFPNSESFRMSDDILETYIQQYVSSSSGHDVTFVWHGGEPTLTGLDFFRKVIELQKIYLPEGWNCWNNLQTNGTLLDEEWCAFLADNHFDVGLSIDGPQWLHDKYRKDRQGNGTWQRAFDAVRRLQSHGIQPDLLCTVTSDSARDPVAVYRALRELGTGWIQFIPIVKRTPDGEVTSESVTGEAYGRFLTSIFDQWLYNDYNRLNVQFFAEMFLVQSGGAPTVCWMAPTCGRVLILEHDGSVYSCDHFVNREHRIGNIIDSALASLIDSPEQRYFGENKQKSLPKQCLSCRWLNMCNGLCPKDRFIESEDSEPGLNYLCEGLRLFFAHAEKLLKKLVRMNKKGINPEVIRKELQSENAIRWNNVGRNDTCPCGSGKKAKNCCWETRPQSIEIKK